MSKLRDKLDFLYQKKDGTAPAADPAAPSTGPAANGLNTRQRLERLVAAQLRQRSRVPAAPSRQTADGNVELTVRSYPLRRLIGPVQLSAWSSIPAAAFGTLFPNTNSVATDFRRPLFIDTETTGLSGGVGTLPFMIGSGFFEPEQFTVQVMTLLDPADEEGFLRQWLQLIRTVRPDCLVSFNGKAFDLPLLESRFILNRLPFELDALPHLDFLYPARSLWGWTFPSRRLGLLGEELLGLSRQDDIAGEFIPALYFSYLRQRRLTMLEPVIEHNALDIVGLAALIVLAASYLQDGTLAGREGEQLGLAQLYERSGNLDAAQERLLCELSACRSEKIRIEAIRRLALGKKRRKLYQEAAQLWQELLPTLDKRAYSELIVHASFRDGDPERSMELIREALEKLSLTPAQRRQLEGRLERLRKKLEGIDPQAPQG